MFNHPLHVFVLPILISLTKICWTSCHTLSNRNESIDQIIGELSEWKSWSHEENQKKLLSLMQHFDTNTEKILRRLRIDMLESQYENIQNTTKTELTRIIPYGRENYMFTEKDFMDSSKTRNEVNSNGSQNDVRFFLYTKKNALNPDELIIDNMDTLKCSNFIYNAPVKVLTVGFDTNVHDAEFLALLNLNASYLNPRTEDSNIILIDWYMLGIGPDLIAAIHNLQIAAEQIAKFVKFLVYQRATTLDQVHLIGHSLGCHLAGDTGFYIYQLIGQKVSRVTGLDPGEPVFALANERGRIDPTDGSFVDVIHTSGLQSGLLRSMGHVDFYVNGGLFQPACSNFDDQLACSHEIVHNYFSESILYPIAFKACKCSENVLSDFSSCGCNGTNSIAYMGYNLSPRTRGIFYLETNDKPLFGRG